MNPYQLYEQDEASGSNDLIITIHDTDTVAGASEGEGFAAGQVDDVVQDIGLAEVKDFDDYKRGPVENSSADVVYSDLEAGLVKSDVDSERSAFWPELAEQDKSASKEAWSPLDKDAEKLFRPMDTRVNELDLIKQSFGRDPFPSKLSGDPSRISELKSFKPEEEAKGPSTLHGHDSIGRGLHSSVERLNSLKVPQAVVAFAQAAAKVNSEHNFELSQASRAQSRPFVDLPGWPLLSPAKPQLQKCDKCSREFCSTLNYRRHIRLHRRSAADDKDLRSERSQLAAFWNKLSADEASEIVSFRNLMLENLSGLSATKALSTFIQQTCLVSYPLAYMKAGSALLDIVQNKGSTFPLAADELLRVLDDASESTFLCGGTSPVIQRFVYHGDVEKVGLEEKNLVASMAFLVEQKLVKAWMAEKDAEALRCEKALVEEEEAAERKRAKLLEKKRLKKIRQKGSKDKDRKAVPEFTPNLDGELAVDEEVNSPRTGEDDDYSLPTGSSSSSVVSSGHDVADGFEEAALRDPGAWDAFATYDASGQQEQTAEEGAKDLPAFTEQPPREELRRKEDNMVDQKIGKVLRERRRPNYLASSSYHRSRRDVSDGPYQSSFRARRSQGSGRTDSGSQQLYRKKLGGLYRGIVKNGSSRAVWTRKQVNRGNDAETGASSMHVTTADAACKPSGVENLQVSPTCSTCSFEDILDSVDEESEVGQQSLMVGSLNVPLPSFTKSSVSLPKTAERSVEAGGRAEETRPSTVRTSCRQELKPGTGSSTGSAKAVKVWRVVGRVGEHQESEGPTSLTSDGEDPEAQSQNKRSHADMLAASDSLMSERALLPNLNIRPGAVDTDASTAASPSPTSTVLASFLSRRWASAVDSASDETSSMYCDGVVSTPKAAPSGGSKTARMWHEEDIASKSQHRNLNNTCSKTAGRWHRNQKEKHSQQQYMPRRQVSTAQH